MKLRYGSAGEVGMSAEIIKSAEDCVEKWVLTGETQASAILIARKGIIVSHKAFGKSSNEENSPDLSFDTIFPLGSVTKPLTATAAMILYEDGRLDINKPVKEYIPEYTGDKKENVRVHQLMTHSSGMSDDVIHDYVDKQLPQSPDREHLGLKEWMKLGYAAPLWKQPGEEMSYCNYGIQLLGDIIERVSGKGIEEFARERIFDPLGMNSTFFIVPRSEWNRVIRRNKDMEGGEWFVSPEALETPSTAGGAYSTVPDMAVFCQMYLNKGTYNGIRILKPETVAEMTKNHVPGLCARFNEEFFEEASWGYCWDIAGNKYAQSDMRSPRAFSHNGYGGEFIMVDPVFSIVFICFFIQKPMPFFNFAPAITAAVKSIDNHDELLALHG